MIVLGEIRDAETARTAIRAALTGHLVMSTLHAKNAKGALYRMLEFGVTMNELEQTMVAIAAQRLIELACPFCGETCELYCNQIGQSDEQMYLNCFTERSLVSVSKRQKENTLIRHTKHCKG